MARLWCPGGQKSPGGWLKNQSVRADCAYALWLYRQPYIIYYMSN